MKSGCFKKGSADEPLVVDVVEEEDVDVDDDEEVETETDAVEVPLGVKKAGFDEVEAVDEVDDVADEVPLGVADFALAFEREVEGFATPRDELV